MTKPPWHRRNPSLLASIGRAASAVQPRMHIVETEDRALFRGQFDVRGDDGLRWEAFAIELELSPMSPRTPPIAREIGGRIPQREPHHVNGDGSLCVLLPAAFWYDYPNGIALADYVDGPLRRHLCGQAVVLREGQWPQGEWAHGLEGEIQFVEERLGRSLDDEVTKILATACSGVRGHAPCPCGSGKRLRACHGPLVAELRATPRFADLCRVIRAGYLSATAA